MHVEIRRTIDAVLSRYLRRSRIPYDESALDMVRLTKRAARTIIGFSWRVGSAVSQGLAAVTMIVACIDGLNMCGSQ